MNRLCRLLLLCLVALALPLQGLAAAGVLPCASGHLPGTHAGMAHGAGAHQAHHEFAPAVAHDDCEGAQAPAGALPPAGDAAQDLGSATGHKCSACAACGTGVALPASAPVLPATGPEPAPALIVEAATVSFIAGGLERPPRSPLA